MRKDNDNAGFTLIELLMVMTIAAILMTLALFFYNQTRERDSVVNDVESLASFLKARKLEAFTSKAPITVTFNGTGTQLIANNTITGFNNTLTLQNAFVGPVLNITARGVVAGIGGTYRLVNPDPALNTGSAYSCVAINNVRIRTGTWSGAACVLR